MTPVTGSIEKDRKKNGTGRVECVFCLSDDIDIGVYIYIKIVSFFFTNSRAKGFVPKLTLHIQTTSTITLQKDL